MRISFGGGRRRGPYSPHISFELGPVGSMIVGLIMTIIGGFIIAFSLLFFNVILLVIGLVFFVLGIYNYKINKSIIKTNKNKED